MRTVFVNPAYSGTFKAMSRKKRKNPLVLNPWRRRGRRRNPSFKFKGVAMETLMLMAGAAGGAALNRVGLVHVPNFYLRNGARVAAAALLAAYSNSPLAHAAAGAALAPMLPEVETQLISPAAKNPHELAAELAAMLEADLEDGDDLSADLEDELDWGA